MACASWRKAARAGAASARTCFPSAPRLPVQARGLPETPPSYLLCSHRVQGMSQEAREVLLCKASAQGVSAAGTAKWPLCWETMRMTLWERDREQNDCEVANASCCMKASLILRVFLIIKKSCYSYNKIIYCYHLTFNWVARSPFAFAKVFPTKTTVMVITFPSWRPSFQHTTACKCAVNKQKFWLPGLSFQCCDHAIELDSKFNENLFWISLFMGAGRSAQSPAPMPCNV